MFCMQYANSRCLWLMNLTLHFRSIHRFSNCEIATIFDLIIMIMIIIIYYRYFWNESDQLICIMSRYVFTIYLYLYVLCVSMRNINLQYLRLIMIWVESCSQYLFVISISKFKWNKLYKILAELCEQWTMRIAFPHSPLKFQFRSVWYRYCELICDAIPIARKLYLFDLIIYCVVCCDLAIHFDYTKVLWLACKLCVRLTDTRHTLQKSVIQSSLPLQSSTHSSMRTE